jgi:hypothetical protein
MDKKRNSLAEHLHDLLNQAQGQDVSVKMILNTLTGKGQALLLVLLSLPFCQPIQIPCFSLPFGILLAFIGLRIAFGHHAWLPQALLERKISYQTLEKIASVAIRITDKLCFFISTRWVWLVNAPLLHTIHGVTIVLLALILAIPMPIPLTNLLSAYPLLAFGLAILEDDGAMILIAYLLACLCFALVISVLLFGKEILFFLMNYQ